MSAEEDPTPTQESRVLCEDSLSRSPKQPDRRPKSDQETLCPPHPNLDPDVNSAEEEEDDDEEVEEVDEGQEHEAPAIASGAQPMASQHASAADVTLAPLSAEADARRGATQTKKGKGKGKGRGKGKSKGKPHVKKQQAIEEKFRRLVDNLSPIPFVPRKILDFARHETLLKKLGLWDFVQIEFDRDIRVDLIAQLVASYEAKPRASYVNGLRIRVNRADLARAIRLPLKKERGNAGGGGGVDVDLDSEVMPDQSIRFMEEFALHWVLLHDDIWMMPNEVREWMKVIEEGHPEKVDWAGLFWFMVEKELKQGGKLSNCYYASHLQLLIKSQREELFLKEDPAKGDGVNEGCIEVGASIDGHGEENHAMVGPSTELTLGQDCEKDDVNTVDVENCKASDKEGEGEEQGQWLLDGRNNLGEHFMQPCDAENAEEFGGFEDRKDEDDEEGGEEEEEAEEEMDEDDDEEDAGNAFHVFSNDNALEGDGFTGNLLQAMEANPMAFNAEEHLHSPSSADIRADIKHIGSTHSLFNSAGKRVIEHDSHASHRALNESNKRLRINESWDHKPEDFGMCMEQIQQLSERARIMFEEKEQSLEQANMHQQILLSEMQKRDSMIEHLHKSRLDEVQKKDGEIYRLERELYLMDSVLDGYRKALKETRKAFTEYREKAQLPEEPTYKDAGPGGLMLTAAEIEKLEKRREEEYKMNCLIFEQKMRETEEDLRVLFEGHLDKVNLLDKQLTAVEADAKKLVELYESWKVLQTGENVPEDAETLLISQTEEKVAEVAEPPENEEKLPEVTDLHQIPQTEEKLAEIEEALPKE